MKIEPGNTSKWVVFPVLSLVIFTSGCCFSSRVAMQKREAEAAVGIEKRLGEVLDACEKKDFPRLESYHLYGPKFTRYSASSAGRFDADSTRQAERYGISALQDLSMRSEALKIDVFGEVGIATFILEYQGTIDGRPIHERERTTLVFAREKGEWKIVHEHLSPINGGAAGGEHAIADPSGNR